MRNSQIQWFAIMALCVAGALAPAQSQPVLHSAVDPAPRDGNWQNRARLLDQRLKDTPDTQLLFIGDSITQGWEGAGVTNIWNRYYARRKAVNLGIGGDRTQHVLWRLQKAPLTGVKPKAAVLMIGTNNSNGEDNTPEQIAQGIAAIVGTIRERLPETKILLLGIFPRGENFNAQRGKLTQINQAIHKLHDGRNVHYLDIGHHFLTQNGLLLNEVMYDYLHLTPKGYELWAEAIEPKLGELLDDRR
jgi:beta-glucosidase